MNRFAGLLLGLLLSSSLLACSNNTPGAPAPTSAATAGVASTNAVPAPTTAALAPTSALAAATLAPQSVLARIGPTTITVADFEARMRQEFAVAVNDLLAQGQTPEQIQELAAQQQVQASLLDSLIMQELLFQQARREGISVDPAEVDARMEELLADPINADLSADEQLQRREQIIRDEIFNAMLVEHITFDRFRSRHILVETQEQADTVLARLADGEDFAALAQELSTDTGSGAQGGDLGWRVTGEFVPEFEQAALSAELNTPVVAQSQFGFHIIETLERENAVKFASFDELIASPAAQQLYEATFVPYYDDLRAQAEADGSLQVLGDPASIPIPIDVPETQPATTP